VSEPSAYLMLSRDTPAHDVRLGVYGILVSFSNVRSRYTCARYAFRVYVILVLFSDVRSQYTCARYTFRVYVILVSFSNVGSQYTCARYMFRVCVILVLGSLLLVIFATAVCVPRISHIRNTSV
jgi:hypothetical protein